MSYGSSWFSRADLFCRRKSYLPTYLPTSDTGMWNRYSGMLILPRNCAGQEQQTLLQIDRRPS